MLVGRKDVNKPTQTKEWLILLHGSNIAQISIRILRDLMAIDRQENKSKMRYKSLLAITNDVANINCKA